MFYNLDYLHLKDFIVQVFKKMGCSDDDALLAAEVLNSADLRGVDSHGIARLVGYVRLHEKGRINPTPKIKVQDRTLSTATVDGDAGLGLTIAPYAMDIAIQKALRVGTGWVTVQNSNHFGIAAFHTMKALPHDCIGIAMTNASPLVAPTRSKERLLGTNPISIAIPSLESPPFVLDMATTAAANGKLEVLQRMERKAPEGWIQSQDGTSSTDAHALKKGGAMIPLGGLDASHKGYGLGAMVDILSGVLSGANFGPWVPPFVAFLDPLEEQKGKGVGHFFGAIHIEAFRDGLEFKRMMDTWLERFRNATPISEESVLIPGDPERETTKKRMKEGIPIHQAVLDDLKALEKRFGVKLKS